MMSGGLLECSKIINYNYIEYERCLQEDMAEASYIPLYNSKIDDTKYIKVDKNRKAEWQEVNVNNLYRTYIMDILILHAGLYLWIKWL